MRRLQLALPERIGLLHLFGAVDLLALLLAFLIVGGMNGREVGAKVQLMGLGSPLPVESGVVVITARGTAAFPVITVGKEIISIDEVAAVLLAQKKANAYEHAYLSIEKSLPLTVQETLLLAINKAQLDCTMIGAKRKAPNGE